MTGLGQILEHNLHLRERVRQRDAEVVDLTARLAERDAQLAAQAARLAEQDALLAAQAAHVTEQAKRIEVLNEQVGVLTASNEHLAQTIEFAEKRRALAAAERFVVSELQSTLFKDAEVAAPPRDSEVEKKDEKGPRGGDKRKFAKHKRKGRRKVDDLPFPKLTVEAPMDPSTCETCGGDREIVEPRVSHRVGWRPGQFTVVEVHQERCQCPHCPKADVITAPEPFLLPGAMCDDGLLARVIVDKFGDHLPLNRQADRMTRDGFQINENVLSGWVRAGWSHVGVLVRALSLQVASTSTLLGDDSGFPVQDGTDGKLANGRLWVYTDQKQAFFAFSRTKEGEHPAAVLAALGVSNIRLLVDGGSEYNAAETSRGLTRGGCWAHLRRYFFNAAIDHPEANAGLATLHDLFMVERELVGRPAAERLAARQQRSKPLVDGFFTWVKATSLKARPKSKLGEAVGYAIRQEKRMRVFLAHGDLPLHNNLSELLLRQPIVGRKNWLFAGSEGGARAAAGWFSLIASCRMQRIDPWTYLHDVFGRLQEHPAKWVHELTPLNWRLAVEAGDLVPTSRANPA